MTIVSKARFYSKRQKMSSVKDKSDFLWSRLVRRSFLFPIRSISWQSWQQGRGQHAARRASVYGQWEGACCPRGSSRPHASESLLCWWSAYDSDTHPPAHTLLLVPIPSCRVGSSACRSACWLEFDTCSLIDPIIILNVFFFLENSVTTWDQVLPTKLDLRVKNIFFYYVEIRRPTTFTIIHNQKKKKTHI